MLKLKPLEPAHESDGVRMFCGDARATLLRLRNEGVRPKLIYADPPFNINRKYDEWNDAQPFNAYLRFTYAWMDECVAMLPDDGTFIVNCYDNAAAEIVLHAKRRGLVQFAWVIWHYRFGQCQKKRLINSKQHVLIFKPDTQASKDAVRMNRVLEASDRATKYNDKRTHVRTGDGVPGMRPPLDVWHGDGFSRVNGNSKERRAAHDNQIPERYMRRVVLMFTDKGDLVLDPFSGSGTSGVIAHAHGRPYIGIDNSDRCLASAFERIMAGPVTNSATDR
jgi:DNA modification methylase